MRTGLLELFVFLKMGGALECIIVLPVEHIADRKSCVLADSSVLNEQSVPQSRMSRAQQLITNYPASKIPSAIKRKPPLERVRKRFSRLHVQDAQCYSQDAAMLFAAIESGFSSLDIFNDICIQSINKVIDKQMQQEAQQGALQEATDVNGDDIKPPGSADRIIITKTTSKGNARRVRFVPFITGTGTSGPLHHGRTSASRTPTHLFAV